MEIFHISVPVIFRLHPRLRRQNNKYLAKSSLVRPQRWPRQCHPHQLRTRRQKKGRWSLEISTLFREKVIRHVSPSPLSLDFRQTTVV